MHNSRTLDANITHDRGTITQRSRRSRDVRRFTINHTNCVLSMMEIATGSRSLSTQSRGMRSGPALNAAARLQILDPTITNPSPRSQGHIDVPSNPGRHRHSAAERSFSHRPPGSRPGTRWDRARVRVSPGSCGRHDPQLAGRTRRNTAWIASVHTRCARLRDAIQRGQHMAAGGFNPGQGCQPPQARNDIVRMGSGRRNHGMGRVDLGRQRRRRPGVRVGARLRP